MSFEPRDRQPALQVLRTPFKWLFFGNLASTQTDKPMLGRVMSLYFMSMQIGMVGSFPGAWVGERIGNDWMLLGAGGSLVVVVFAIILTSREMGRL